MGEPLLKLELTTEEVLEKKLKERIFDTHTEELIIGLCGPIGTEIHFVADQISAIMKEKFGYACSIIKLSKFIRIHSTVQNDPEKSRILYLNELISNGNILRQNKGDSVLAELAIQEIAVNREIVKNDEKEDSFKSQRICYIIDSIKNNEELDLFRLIYTNLFYFIGVFSNLDIRVKNLEKKNIQIPDIYKLIDRDSGEDKHFGQKVADTFVQADYFLRIDQANSAKVGNKLNRFFSLVFSSEISTPSVNETAMYQAFAAAGNSACLSRQVGASITNSEGEIISVGWNDVPKFSGGVYKYDDVTDPLGTNDHRCLNMEGGICFNDQEKNIIRTSLINVLIDEGVISKSNQQKAENIIKSSRIKELIEFSRAVHAEMHAIIIGSQKDGQTVKGGKLFCTTYPCHNCARHIVVAGIKEVYYIEPYRKSLALKLHGDSITEDENFTNKVKILMFDGVSPRRYLDFFKVLPNSRKENGKRVKVNTNDAYPKNTVSLQAIPILEKEIIKELKNKNLIELEDE